MTEHLIKAIRDKGDPKLLSPLVLAYIGDAVFELYVRLGLIPNVSKVQRLHKQAIQYVRAQSQADILKSWEPLLSEEEEAIVRRGRNAKSAVPKSADMITYRRSTAMEALIGYLYVSGQEQRLWELLNMGVCFDQNR